MTVELYLEKLSGEGIGRRYLAEGFPDEVTEDQKAPRNSDARKPVGQRVCPVVLEDLSGMNGPKWLRARETGRKGGQSVKQRWRGVARDERHDDGV